MALPADEVVDLLDVDVAEPFELIGQLAPRVFG